MSDSEKLAAIRALLDSFISRGTYGEGEDESWITVEDHHYYDNRFLDDLFAILDEGPRVVDDRKLTEPYESEVADSITVKEDVGGPYPQWKRIVLDLHSDGTVRWRRSRFDQYYDTNLDALRRETKEPPITEQTRQGFIPFEGDDRG